MFYLLWALSTVFMIIGIILAILIVFLFCEGIGWILKNFPGTVKYILLWTWIIFLSILGLSEILVLSYGLTIKLFY